jgi:hypothetical protein
VPPAYPVLLPPPQNISFGTVGYVLIDPCNITVNTTVTASGNVNN